MLATAEFREERAELHALISSGIFHRAPHLLSFLTYVCERSFQGQGDQIKEYTIGVEAFGRLSSFDPKKDSIVRVEAHRLRRRLEEYYLAEGAAHRIRIEIPNGQYTPRFVVQACPATPALAVGSADSSRELDLAEASPSDSFERAPATLANPDAAVRTNWPWLILLLGVASLGLTVLWRSVSSSRAQPPAPREETWTGPATQPVPAEFRMLTGYHGAPFTDQQGHSWSPDAYFTGGFSAPIPGEHLIQGQPEPNLLRSQRSGQFRYDIPLTKGTHELRLYFAETDYGPGNRGGGGETARMFHIQINGVDAVPWIDPIAEAGGANRMLVRVFKDVSPAADGKLHLAFAFFNSPGLAGRPAFLNALEILQSKPGFIHPIRIVTQDQPVTDVDGRTWSSDEYFFGGSLAYRSEPVVNARDKALYRGERYGNFSYHIPLAKGKFRLTLHFAETWFGTPESNEPALGARRFSVFANGSALLQNFEIAKEVGVNHEVTKVFENLEPGACGALWVEFIPLENYAEVNALEVEQTE
jgi:hypothetical protein